MTKRGRANGRVGRLRYKSGRGIRPRPLLLVVSDVSTSAIYVPRMSCPVSDVGEFEQRQCQGGPGVRGVRLTDEGDGKEGPLSPGSKAYLYVSLWPSYYDHHLNV